MSGAEQEDGEASLFLGSTGKIVEALAYCSDWKEQEASRKDYQYFIELRRRAEQQCKPWMRTTAGIAARGWNRLISQTCQNRGGGAQVNALASLNLIHGQAGGPMGWMKPWPSSQNCKIAFAPGRLNMWNFDGVQRRSCCIEKLPPYRCGTDVPLAGAT